MILPVYQYLIAAVIAVVVAAATVIGIVAIVDALLAPPALVTNVQLPTV